MRRWIRTILCWNGVKFFCIVSSNLDEFFEVRVAGLKQQMESDVVERSMDGLTATETFRRHHARVRQMVDDQYACWREELLPAAGQKRHPRSRNRPNWTARTSNGCRNITAPRCGRC